MPILDYEPKPHHRPWRPPSKESLTETLVGALCVAANVVLPIVLVGKSPLKAAIYCGTVLLCLVLMNFWVGAKCQRSLAKKGLRRGTSIRVIGIILVPLSILNAAVFTPLLARYALDLDAASHVEYQRMAFERATLFVNLYCVNEDIYPADLNVLLDTNGGVELTSIFPDATPAEVSSLNVLATALKTRPPTAAEADLIERAARLRYVGIGLVKQDVNKDFLVLISTVAADGEIQLGYSSGRVDRVPNAAVAGLITKENAKRAARGLPSITWP